MLRNIKYFIFILTASFGVILLLLRYSVESCEFTLRILPKPIEKYYLQQVLSDSIGFFSSEPQKKIVLTIHKNKLENGVEGLPINGSQLVPLMRLDSKQYGEPIPALSIWISILANDRELFDQVISTYKEDDRFMFIYAFKLSQIGEKSKTSLCDAIGTMQLIGHLPLQLNRAVDLHKVNCAK